MKQSLTLIFSLKYYTILPFLKQHLIKKSAILRSTPNLPLAFCRGFLKSQDTTKNSILIDSFAYLLVKINTLKYSTMPQPSPKL